ncbi:hypothetical protein GWK41_05055 [Persephonella atlantica]|uniref:VWFA domain-containing protein n=1 Tax=Persephonella atlantica TaxID=2699429 RepID=A0ABS1GHQ5_9AQUI|nr:hypothetical protein [Persephonella atlantica]MBK3332428.1 hypothetical protein [Persephonella atlantica]
MHVNVNNLVDNLGNPTATYTNLLSKLDPKEDDEDGYMSCTKSDKNKCPYIISAGLTPTAGTFQTAIDYFEGDDSPIQYRCQKNFIIYVTDGLPSVDEDGNTDTADNLLPDVISKIDKLRNIIKDINGTDYTFDIKTYVLGVGLTDDAKQKLDTMATHGGTDYNGHAYYADNPQQLNNALKKIFREILKEASAGTSVSILSEKRKSGSVVTQAVFYPQKVFAGDRKVSWISSLFTYWSLNTRKAQNLREDTNKNYILDVYNSIESQYDHILRFFVDSGGQLKINTIRSNPDGTAKLDDSECSTYTTSATCNASSYCLWDNVLSKCYLDYSKTASYCENITDITTCNNDKYCQYSYLNESCMIDESAAFDVIQTYSSLDDIKYLWDSGKLLKDREADDRVIFGIDEDGEPKLFERSNSSLFDSILGTNPDYFPSCLVDEDGDIKYGDLIDFVRGKHIEGCRSRVVDDDYNTWKLGDIIYSTPKIVNYEEKGYSVAFTSSNDGMLHAFLTGYLSKEGLTVNQAVKICDSKNNCTTTELGKELWAFIPKNAMPYLRYLADPDYCHIYINDLSPYIIETDYDRDGDKEVVLIGGMRFGGGCGCDGTNCVRPPDDTCPSPDSCVGLSSYFALDITDPENPQFLWEFSHPELNFSFSGPAHIVYNNTHYVMFLSGPTNYNGDAGGDLKAFVLKLDSSFKYDSDSVYVLDFNVSNAFGGRLFTEGIDYNGDGNTDMVFFGISHKAGSVWQGNVYGLKIDDSNPSNWDKIKLFNSAIKPITAKVEHMKCFNMDYIFFGTGRWFYKLDEPGQNSNDKEAVYGVRIDGCLTGNSCNINSAHSVNDTCSELDKGTKTVAWMLSEDLEPRTTKYYKERMITDPTPIKGENLILFTTMQPTGDICGFGGRTRVWMLNCATGAIPGEACPGGGYATTIPAGTIYLQASGANIVQIKGLKGASKWIQYTPPESATQYVPPTGYGKGELLLWIEK